MRTEFISFCLFGLTNITLFIYCCIKKFKVGNGVIALSNLNTMFMILCLFMMIF